MKRYLLFYIFCLFAATSVECFAGDHPCLLFNRSDIKVMKSEMQAAPMFQKSLDEVLRQAEAALSVSTEVPKPDGGGVGTPVHELYMAQKFGLQNCGIAYQFKSDRKYAEWVRKVLLGYAAIYPELDYHTYGHTAELGRMFWQVLDDFVWTVHAIIAYDCIYDTLSSRDRKTIETRLFRPIADFFMYGTEDNRKNNQIFNMMHNHATWNLTAVGMIGFVLGDDDFVMKSLMGTDLSGENGGFYGQISTLFSPDGYYREGAYYQRYALYPYMLYGQCLDRLKPEADVFHRHGGALLKSAMALVNMAYDGRFFNMNDASDMRYSAWELETAFDVVYSVDPSQKQLLSIIQDYHNKVMISQAGFRTARDIAAGQAQKPVLQSICLRDGADGDRGATMILRSGKENSAITMKATTQGSYHGHFDRLTLGYFADGQEVLKDYGFARFVSLGIKNNGAYTPENKSYAMTSVAHNTLVVDENSHYGGVMRHAMLYWPQVLAFDAQDKDFQYMAARDTAAYPGVTMERWTAMAELPFLEHPLLIDILLAESDSLHCYDYPIHHEGHMMRTNVHYTKAMTEMKVLGSANGYQHLWTEASGKGAEGTSSYTWLAGERFYTVSAATSASTEVYFLRTGASDQNFYLYSEPAILLREHGRNHCFASCLESHGRYVRHIELAQDAENACQAVEVLGSDNACTKVKYSFRGGHTVLVTIRNGRMELAVS